MVEQPKPNTYLGVGMVERPTLVKGCKSNQPFTLEQPKPTLVKGWLSKSSAVVRSFGSWTKHCAKKFFPEIKTWLNIL
jgi:hypothetical protein